MVWYFKVLGTYFNFKGRARRKEFWMYHLCNAIIVFMIGFIGRETREELIVELIYRIFILVPTIAVAVRRMHDTNHSGWWVICPIYNIVLWCRNGDIAENLYGDDPKKTDGNTGTSISKENNP